MPIVVTLDAVAKGVLNGFSITESANNRNTLTCSVPSPDGTFRPDLDDEIGVTESAVKLFGGLVQTPTERGLADGGPAIATDLECADFHAYLDRRYITGTVVAGTTLKAALESLIPYLTTYGITLNAAQVTGPTLPELVWNRKKAKDVFTELATLSNYIYEVDYNKVLTMFALGSRSAPFSCTASTVVGDVTVTKSRESAGSVYANRVTVFAGTDEVPIFAVAEDAIAIAANGLWEVVIRADDVFEQATADALAAAYLAQRLPTPRVVTYQTWSSGLHPGQVQTINLPRRNVNNSFIISEVTIQQVEGEKRLHTVTALEGSIFQPGWRNLYQQWTSPMTQVTVVPAAGAYGRSVYYLGGSAIQLVQWDTTLNGPFNAVTSWVPVEGTVANPGMQVAIDTVARGSTSAMVTVRMRALAGNVTARLRNISDNIVVGTSSVVASTTFQSVSFIATLTAGSKIYQLELLPSLANTDVAAIAYVE